MAETISRKSGWDTLLGNRTLTAIRTDVRHPFQHDANGVAIEIDDMTVFFFEDPADGYRSCCAEPLIATTALYSFGVSPDYIRVPVSVSVWTDDEEGDVEGLVFTDQRNCKVVLRVGTGNANDYYPFFVCDWRPQDLADNELSSPSEKAET